MTYDCIIVGAGVMGLSAGYHISREGKNVLILEQFTLPHTRGSSHGASRSLRASYDNPLYSHMTIESLQLWKRLERETNTSIFRTTGLLMMSKPPYKDFEDTLRCTRGCGVECEELSREDVYRELGGAFSLPQECRIFREIGAGTLRADKALDCLRRQIKKFGGEITDEEKVEHIFPGPVVTIRTQSREYKSRHLIITPGSWIAQLLKPLGLNIPCQVERVTVCFFKEKIKGSTKSMPLISDLSAEIYGVPSSECDGLVKVGNYWECGVRIDNPDFRDACYDNTAEVGRVCSYIKNMIPGLESRPSIMETCIFTVTPDKDFVIDSLPNHPNIVFGAGFSAHGFKMAPVVGRILSRLAFGEKLSYDITPLRINRFPNHLIASSL